MNLPRDVANFLSASGGKQIVYLKDYADLRRFCVDALKWADEDDSLMPELADEEDFVFLPIRKVSCWLPISVLVSATNEIRNIIRRLPNKKGPNCFIFRLCPIDLLHYAMQHGLLPEVAFPFGDGRRLLHENWDFIARRYLGKYYNEDFYEEERK